MTVHVILLVVAALVAGVSLSFARSARTESRRLAGLLDHERVAFEKKQDNHAISLIELGNRLTEKDLLIESLRKSLNDLEVLHRDVCSQITALAAERDLQRRRADEFFAMIDGVVKEKDGIWHLYRTSAQQAGAAQTWLFRELSQLYHLVNEYRKYHGEAPLDLPKELAALVGEFTDGAKQIPERAPEPALPPSAT